MARRVNASQPSLSHSDRRWSSSIKTPIRRPPSTSSCCTPTLLSVKSILLHNWWLIRPEGKGLGVSGFESRGNLGVRMFSSGAIAKRLDAITLETEDGIKVELIGTINQSETHQNGFPFEVCSQFLLGFPFHWESYATKSYVGKSKGKDATKSDSFDFNKSSLSPANSSDPISMDDIPVNRIRDLIMSPFGRFGDHIEGSILTDILGRVSNNVSKCTPIPINSELINGNPNESVNSGSHCSPSNHKKSKAERRCTSNEGNLETKHFSRYQRIMDDTPKIYVGLHTPNISVGIATRRMTRSKNHGSQQEQNIPDSFLKYKTSNQLPSSELEIQSGDDFQKKSKTNHSSKSYSKHNEYAKFSTPEGHGMVATSEVNGMNTDVIPRQGDQLHKKPKTIHSSKSSSKQVKYVEASMPEGQVECAVRRSSTRLRNQNKNTNQGY